MEINQLRMASTLLDKAYEFYEKEENKQAFEAWKKERRSLNESDHINPELGRPESQEVARLAR